MAALKTTRSSSSFWRTIGVAFFVGVAFTLVVLLGLKKPIFAAGDPAVAPTPPRDTILRLNGYKKIKPILSVDRQKESTKMQPLKRVLEQQLDSLKKIGFLTEASIYLRDLDKGRWISINPQERYHPASLMKVPLLLAWLRMAEATPGLLTQEFVYERPAGVEINPQYYPAPTIQPGKKYTVHELLYYMIAYSDNHATWLLASRLNPNALDKIFADFGLPAPERDDLKFTMDTQTFALFFKSIYNSAYLSAEYSEYAANMLSNCSFNEGMVKGLPAGADIWHKFGEWRHENQDHELHESAVVVLNGRSYLLTVMTRGKDTDRLAQVIQGVARQVNRGVGLLEP